MAKQVGHALAVYNSAGITLTDGDETGLFVNGSGYLLTASGGTGASANQVQGTAADNAAAVGNPVRTGHVYNTAAPTYANGDIADFQSDVNGNSKVTSGTATGATVPGTAYYQGVQSSAGNLTGVAAIGAQTDGATGNSAPPAGLMTFNGSTFDRTRSAANATNSTGTGIMAAAAIAQLDDTSPTAITENQFGNVRMSADRSLLVTSRATTPTQTSVAGSASSVSLLAANNARKGAVITNDSSAVLYIKLGTTASTTSYTVTLAGSASAPFSSYEVPFGYVGAIDGIWASATGNARITEIA